LSDDDIWEGEDEPLAKGNGNIIKPDFGSVIESGEGQLEHEIYMDGHYMSQTNRIRQDRKRKREELIKLCKSVYCVAFPMMKKGEFFPASGSIFTMPTLQS